MEWLKRILPMRSPDAFARMFVRKLVASGLDRSEIEYDAAQFLLRIRSSDHFLGNIYSICRNRWPWERGREIARFVRGSLATLEHERESFEEASPRLLPGIRDRALWEFQRLRAEIEGKGAMKARPIRKIGSRLELYLFVDSDEGMRWVVEDDLSDWGKSVDELLAIALENLRARSAAPLQALSEHVFTGVWNDCYDPARILLPEILAQIDAPGNPVAIAPTWNHLLLTGESEPAALCGAIAFARSVVESDGRPISALPVVSRGGEWVDLELPRGHAAHGQLRDARALEMSGLYQEQAELLNRLLESKGEDIFVGSVFVAKRRGSQELNSWAVWSKDVDTLLPKAEQVSFFDGELPEAEQIVAEIDWDLVAFRCAELLEPTEQYPPRFRVRSFPLPEILDRMRKEQEARERAR